MNGAQDLGGAMGFGPIDPEPNEPPFHAGWERRALAVTLAMGATGTWTIDESRHARESLHPADYLASSYYEIWIKGLERLLARHGLVEGRELQAGRALAPAVPVKRVLKAAEVAPALARGSRADCPPRRTSRGRRTQHHVA